MSDTKISALPSASTLTGAERLPVSQSNQTRGATMAQVKTWAMNGGTPEAGAFTTVTATTITPSGLIDISGPGAGQISFPATQNPSAGVNVLDDYEEGTSTPTLTFGGASVGITYSSQVCMYTKIGNRIFFYGTLVLTNKGSSVGAALINTNLPFTVNSNISVVTLGRVNNFAASAATALTAFISNTSPIITLRRFAAGIETDLADTDFQNNTVISFSGSIQAA